MISPHSTRNIQNSGDQSHELIRSLQTNILIKGSFRQHSGRVKIGTQLSSSHDGRVLWAEQYHKAQVRDFADSGADIVSALTMNYGAEALGIVRAARKAGVPVSISFTVETNGKLPSGETLQNVIERIDKETGYYPSYCMINCAHPEHFKSLFQEKADWQLRIRGIRANASEKSHEELENSETLDSGDINKLVSGIREIRSYLPGLNVLGGCCGTDHTHIEAMCSI